MNRLKAFLSISHTPNEYAISYMKSDEYVEFNNTRKLISFKSKNKSSNIIIFYPGARIRPECYSPLAYLLAKNNIDTIICKFPLNMSILNIKKANKYFKLNQYNNYFLMGHSLGTIALSIFLDKKYRKEIKGFILLGGYSIKDLNKFNINTLSIFGSKDRILNKSIYKKNKSYLPNLTEKIIEGGNHSQFGSYIKQKNDGNAKISNINQINITLNTILSWMNEINIKL